MRDTVKIFVGNVDDRTKQEEMSELFEKYGTVVSCAVMKQYAFVHMRGWDRATKAIEELNGRELNGKKMVVELSKPRPQNTWKIFIGNVGSGCEVSEIRAMFEEYGRVVECDVVKDYAFVHMEKETDARSAIENLNGKEIKGKRINVEMSNKTQRPLSSNGSAHNSRSRRSHEFRDTPPSRSEAYNRRRATEAAYASYALKSPYERYAGESARYDEYENRARPPSPYYSRDRSPLRRPPQAAYYNTLASKYRAPTSTYASLTSAFEGQQTATLPSAFSSQSATMSSAFPGRASALAPAATGYGNQAAYSSQTSTYAAEPVSSSYVAQSTTGYGTPGASLPATYGSQLTAVAQPYAPQTAPSAYPSHTATSTFASSSALGTAYRPQQTSTYDSTQIPGLGSQSTYSAIPATTNTPMYERTRLSPPPTSTTDSYKTSTEAYKSRLAPDRRFSELSDYRRLTQESQDPFRQSPPKSQMDYRRTTELHSDIPSYTATYNDYIRAAQMSGYTRRL